MRRRGDVGETPRRGVRRVEEKRHRTRRGDGPGRRDVRATTTDEIDRPRRRSGHAPAAPEISATISRSAEPSAAVETARMGATATRPRARETAAGARSAAAGALMEASAEDVMASTARDGMPPRKGGATPFRRLADETMAATCPSIFVN